MAVTVCSTAADSMSSRSRSTASTRQPRVTASSADSLPGSIASAWSRTPASRLRQAASPSALASGTWSSCPGMPYMLAANGLAESHCSWNSSASARGDEVTRRTLELCSELRGPISEDDVRAGPSDRRHGFADRAVAVDPTLGGRRLDHRQLARHLIGGDRYVDRVGDPAQHVEVAARRL